MNKTNSEINKSNAETQHVSVVDVANSKPYPIISFIVPVYNSEKYLNKCLSSIACQTLQNIEIIVIDDCSTDSSPKIMTDWAARDKRIKTIRNASNTGPAIARNIGLDAATGEFIAFVDSDDWISIDWAAQLVAASWNTSTSVAVGTSMVIYPDGTQIDFNLFNNSPDGLYNDVIQKNCIYSAWGCIINKKFLDSYGLRFEEKHTIGSEDWPFIFKVTAYANSVVIKKQATYYYRQHENSFVSQVDSETSIYAHYSIDTARKLTDWFRNEYAGSDKGDWLRRVHINYMSIGHLSLFLCNNSEIAEQTFQVYKKDIDAANKSFDDLGLYSKHYKIVCDVLRKSKNHNEFVKKIAKKLPEYPNVSVLGLSYQTKASQVISENGIWAKALSWLIKFIPRNPANV